MNDPITKYEIRKKLTLDPQERRWFVFEVGATIAVAQFFFKRDAIEWVMNQERKQEGQ